MSRIIAALYRHGAYEQPPEVPSAWLPHPLTEEGHAQSREAARELATRARRDGWVVQGILDSSSLLRAWETASTMARTLEDLLESPFRVEESADLNERGLGAAANLTMEEIAAVIRRDPRYPELASDWKATSGFRLPLQGAESLDEAGARVAAHIERRVAEFAEEDRAPVTVKVFVGHGAAIRHAAVRLGVLARADVKSLSMHHCRPVFLERAGPGTRSHLDGAWKVRRTVHAGND